MTLPDQDTLTQDLENIMMQVAAALSTEASWLSSDQTITIEFTGRQVTATVENNSMEFQHEELQNRLFDKLEEKAKQVNPNDLQQAVDDELSPINDYTPESEEVKKKESGPSGVKDIVLNS